MSSEIFDFIIVGSGVSGGFAAYLLAQKEFSVLLVDGRTAVNRKVCGEYICPRGVDLLHLHGFEREIVGKRKVEGMLIGVPDGRLVDARFPLNAQGIGWDRQDLDRHLQQSAVRSGAKLIVNSMVQDCEFKDDFWEVKIRGELIRARVLMGADGRKSMVAHKLGMSRGHSNGRVALHVLLKPKVAMPHRGEMHLFNDGSYIGVNPVKDHEVNLSLVCNKDQLKLFESQNDLFNHYLKQSQRLLEIVDILKAHDNVESLFPLNHQTRNVVGHRVALLGDAAGFIDPLTGEGIYQALLSATLFASQIERKQNNWIRLLDKQLSAYSRTYRKTLRAKVQLNTFFQWLIRHPQLVNLIARYVDKTSHRKSSFIGIIGNVYTPSQGLRQLLE